VLQVGGEIDGRHPAFAELASGAVTAREGPVEAGDRIQHEHPGRRSDRAKHPIRGLLEQDTRALGVAPVANPHPARHTGEIDRAGSATRRIYFALDRRERRTVDRFVRGLRLDGIGDWDVPASSI
jgi:hypothetical protein